MTAAVEQAAPGYARTVTEGLRQRYEAGESAVRIAREVGKPVAFLRYVLAAAGVELRPEDEARRDRVREREWEWETQWIDDLVRRGIAHLPTAPLRKLVLSPIKTEQPVSLSQYVIEARG